MSPDGTQTGQILVQIDGNQQTIAMPQIQTQLADMEGEVMGAGYAEGHVIQAHTEGGQETVLIVPQVRWLLDTVFPSVLHWAYTPIMLVSLLVGGSVRPSIGAT